MAPPPTDKENTAFLKEFEGFVAGSLSCQILQLKVFYGSLFNSPKHSDVTLYLGFPGMKIHAHLAILSVRTSYFDDVSGSRADDGKLEFYLYGEEVEDREPLENPHALYRMLQYVYTGDYSVTPNQADFGIQWWGTI